MSSDKQLNIIATLAAQAPNSDIRNCVKIYDPQHTKSEHLNCFKKVNKDVLSATLTYLNAPPDPKAKKDTLVQSTICRIQNLLPDVCGKCNEEYCVGLNDKPLLCCSTCGQGSHDDCILKILRSLSPPSVDDGSQLDIVSAVKPAKLLGFHYLCHQCEQAYIPAASGTSSSGDDDTAKDAQDSDEPNASNQVDGGGNGNSPPNLGENQSTPAPDKPDDTPKQDDTQNKGNGRKTNHPNLCKFYAKGECRHGISGNGCKKAHPKPCRKLIRHGPKSKSNPDGCPGLPTCTKWHPTLCKTSIKRRECQYEGCKFYHIAGTKRTSAEKKSEAKSEQTSENSTKSADHFLEKMELMKREIMECMDARLQLLQLRPPMPMSYQYPYMPPWGMSPFVPPPAPQRHQPQHVMNQMPVDHNRLIPPQMTPPVSQLVPGQ